MAASSPPSRTSSSHRPRRVRARFAGGLLEVLEAGELALAPMVFCYDQGLDVPGWFRALCAL